jgi:triosephosphate isomerase
MAANWKMHKNPTQTLAFFQEFLPMVAGHTRDEIVVCPPYIDLYVAIAQAKGSEVAVGAQDLHWEKEGAYTGEICPGMLLDIGCTHVIIGHSERRQYFGETDDIVNFKLKAALEAGLTPIVCVGEVLEEREAGLTEDVLRRQCLRAFHAISAKKAAKLIVAYEPVWAIGTGEGVQSGFFGQPAHSLRRLSEARERDGLDGRNGDRRRPSRGRQLGSEIVCRNRQVLTGSVNRRLCSAPQPSRRRNISLASFPRVE